MPTMTQAQLDCLWHKYASRLENEADPDVIREDYHEEIAHLGGIVVYGRGALGLQQATAVLDDLTKRGCAVFEDPAREGADCAVVIFLPERGGTPDNGSLRPDQEEGWPCN